MSQTPMRQAARNAIGVLALTLSLAVPQASSAGNLVEEIVSRGTVTAATEAAYEPFEFIEDGKITGYSKNILDEVVADLGVELNQLNLPWAGILPGMLAKKFDFVATSVSIKAERVKKYAFTHPIGLVQTVLLVRASNTDINAPEDLDGKIIAAQIASTDQATIEEYNKARVASGEAGYRELKLFQSLPETFTSVGSGQVDVGLVASNVAAALLRKQPGKFKIVAQLGKPRFLAWVTHPDGAALRDRINRVIEKLHENGKLKEWQQEWFGFQMDLPTQGYLPEGAV